MAGEGTFVDPERAGELLELRVPPKEYSKVVNFRIVEAREDKKIACRLQYGSLRSSIWKI